MFGFYNTLKVVLGVKLVVGCLMELYDQMGGVSYMVGTCKGQRYENLIITAYGRVIQILKSILSPRVRLIPGMSRYTDTDTRYRYPVSVCFKYTWYRYRFEMKNERYIGIGIGKKWLI